MHAETFLKEFVPLSSGPGGVQKLRELVLELALSGRLLKGQDTPSSWRTYNIDEVADCFTGNSISVAEKSQKYAGLQDGTPYIATKDVEGWHGGIDYDSGVKIPVGEPRFKLGPKGSVLICAEGGSAGRKIGVLDKDVNFGNKLICCVPVSAIVSQSYLFRLFQSPEFQKAFRNEMTGIIGGISLSKFKSLPFRLPELQSQHEIVAKVDQLMTLCDQLELQQAEEIKLRRATTASALNHLTQAETGEEASDRWTSLIASFDEMFDDIETINELRGASLSLAISGLICSDKNSDTIGEEPVTQITDTRTNNTLKIDARNAVSECPFLIPSHWSWKKLADLTNPSKPISYGVIKLGNETKDGIPILRCSDVRYRRIDLDSVKKINPEIELQYLRTRLCGGELLVNIRGTLGGCAIVPKAIAGYNVAREVAVVDPNSAVIAEFLLAVFSSPYFQDRVDSNLKGIAYKGLNLGTLSKFPIPLPPLTEQKRIVAKVDELMALCDRMEEQVREGERLNAALMASLVNQLTEDDPDGAAALESAPSPQSGFSEEAEAHLPPREQSSKKTISNVIPLDEPLKSAIENAAKPVEVDTKFKEAVLVGSIVKAFFNEGGEPIGNFRLQKAVYFARRHNGEHALDRDFARKAAGPYNPSMKYSGGIAIAKQKNWLREARGRFGFGHVPGPEAAEMDEWIAKYSYGKTAQWVAEQFRFKRNEDWETLATVDYAMEHMQSQGIEPDATKIVTYITSDDEWRAKIEKLRLTEVKVQTAIVEVGALFGGD